MTGPCTYQAPRLNTSLFLVVVFVVAVAAVIVALQHLRVFTLVATVLLVCKKSFMYLH